MSQTYAQPFISALVGMDIVALNKSEFQLALAGVVKPEIIGTAYNELHDNLKILKCGGGSPPRKNVSGIGQVTLFGKAVPSTPDKAGRLVADMEASDIRVLLKATLAAIKGVFNPGTKWSG